MVLIVWDPPEIEALANVAGTILAGSVIEATVAFILYASCVREGRFQPGPLHRLIAFIFLSTLNLSIPFWSIVHLSALPSFVLSGICFIGAFKVFEVLYAVVPDAAILTNPAYLVAYFAFPVEIEFRNGRPAEPDPGLMGERRLGKTPAAYLAKTMLNAAAMAPVMSFFQHGGARAWYPTEHALLDNYVGAWATFLFLNFFTDLIGIAESACGFRPITVFRNPLLRSVSPRDMWGRRWNMVIHGLIHRTTFGFFYRDIKRRRSSHETPDSYQVDAKCPPQPEAQPPPWTAASTISTCRQFLGPGESNPPLPSPKGIPAS